MLLAAWASTLGACSYSLGRAPVRGEAVHLAPVEAPTAERGLQQSLHAALARELDRLGADGGALPLQVSVVASGVRSVALGAAVQEAELALLLQVEERSVEVRGRRAFSLVPDDPAATAAAREQAFTTLADELAVEGLARLLRSQGDAS